jgi:hypothetical protein
MLDNNEKGKMRRQLLGIAAVMTLLYAASGYFGYQLGAHRQAAKVTRIEQQLSAQEDKDAQLAIAACRESFASGATCATRVINEGLIKANMATNNTFSPIPVTREAVRLSETLLGTNWIERDFLTNQRVFNQAQVQR